MTTAPQRAKAADPVARLAVLATEIKAKLTLARRHGQAKVSALMDAGDRLQEAKDALDHGQWDDWLSDNFELSDRTARLCMQFARHRARIEAKMATVATLGIREALEQISEDQIQEGKEKRNREALARELARRSPYWPQPKPDHLRPTSYPQLPPSELEKALDVILLQIRLKREWIAQFGLLEQFDAELRRRFEQLDPHKQPYDDYTEDAP